MAWLIAGVVVAAAGWAIGHGAGLVCSAVRYGDVPGLPPRAAGLCLGAIAVSIGLAGCVLVGGRLTEMGLIAQLI